MGNRHPLAERWAQRAAVTLIMAKDLDRARTLRRLMNEIAASPAAPAELVGSLELMALLADWLDPLVNAPWPEVDSISDRNPYGSLW